MLFFGLVWFLFLFTLAYKVKNGNDNFVEV